MSTSSLQAIIVVLRRGLGQILHDQLHWLDVPDRVLHKLAASSDSSPVSERPRTTVYVGYIHSLVIIWLPIEERSIVMTASVCLSVCVFVCLSASISPEPHVRSSPNFCVCWSWLGPLLTALRYVMYFRFYG